MNSIPFSEIDHSWTLFLDRDGVINEKLEDDYVKSWSEFRFRAGVLHSLREFRKQFGRILLVTNQQGIGKGLMSEKDLDDIHTRMMREIEAAGGKLDELYFCPDLKTVLDNCRKPAPRMALLALQDFPEINFSRSLMVGDALTDMEFGKSVGMWTLWVSEAPIPASHKKLIDGQISGLAELVLSQ